MQLDGVAMALQAFGRLFAGGESGVPLPCALTMTYGERACAVAHRTGFGAQQSRAELHFALSPQPARHATAARQRKRALCRHRGRRMGLRRTGYCSRQKQ
jgi:hypothetical protein